MNTVQALAELRRWRAEGWLRPWDEAFARFLHTLDPQVPPSLLIAAALLCHLEARGHSGLPLAVLTQDAQALLGWPEPGLRALAEALSAAGHDASAPEPLGPTSAVLECEPESDDGSAPLVLCAGQLQLRRYWREEARVAACVAARTDAAAPATGPDGIDRHRARALLDQLFGASAETDWQKVACALALRGRLTLIAGGPGTGKTHTAARLLVLLRALHPGPLTLRLALAAPTGKAAARLRLSMAAGLRDLRSRAEAPLPWDVWAAEPGPAVTLHGLLGGRPGTRRLLHDAAHPLDVDLLIVDEASMIHLEMMGAVLDALPATARLVLLGDPDQLASVEAGAVLGDFCGSAMGARRRSGEDALPPYSTETRAWVEALTGTALPPAPARASEAAGGGGLAQHTVILQRSRRFAGPIARLAEAVNRGDGAGSLAQLQAAGEGGAPSIQAAPPGIAWRRSGDPEVVARLALEGGYGSYLDRLDQRPGPSASSAAFEDWVRAVLQHFERFRVLCALREGPWGVTGLNASIEAACCVRAGVLRRSEWYEGRPVMVTRNDPELGVFNGDVGVVLASAGSSALRVWFLDGESLRSVAVGRLAQVETAYAMTVHKSQGSEFGHVLLVLPEPDAALLTRELLYTGITRARQALTVVAADPARWVAACERKTLRWSGLARRLG